MGVGRHFGNTVAAANRVPRLSRMQTHRPRARYSARGTVAPGRIGVGTALTCAGIVGMTGAAALIGLNSAIVDRPAVFVTLRTVASLGMVAVALVALARGSSRRLGTLLLAIAMAFALTGLTGSTVPGLFAIGRITIPITIVLVMYFCLAYPGGRIADRADSLLLAVGAAGLAALLAADLLVTRTPPVAGPFVRCSGGGCPTNPLSVFELPATGRALSSALAVWTALTLAATAALVARRLGAASRLQRRSLAPQLMWAVLLTIAYAFFIAARASNQHAALLTPAAVIVAAIIAALPFAIALGMERGRVLAINGLEHMIAGLGPHPSPMQLERTMSEAFGDPTLELSVWRPSSERYVDSDGHELDSLAARPGRQVTRFTRAGATVAAVAHDPALADERDVLAAAGSAVSLALENARLSADLGTSIEELAASRKRLAFAADEERRRIEQDLHDGAQQGLIALRIKLGLLEELAEDDPSLVVPLLSDAGKQIDATLDQIRSLAQGIYPSALRDLGVARALSAVTRGLPIPIAVHADLGRRFAPEVETVVYFCCVEALQNVAKYCGPQARVNLRLWTHGDGLEFAVSDDGPGFDAALITSTHGITGMRDRLGAIGGTLTVTSVPGRGTTVSGRVPI